MRAEKPACITLSDYTEAQREMIKTTIGSLAKTLCEPNPLTEAYQAERAARRAALTPEQRQIEDLIREVAELKERLSRASHVMAGEDIYDP